MKAISELEALTLGELRSMRADRKQAWKAHNHVCHECRSAGGNTARYCDDGWAIVLDKRLISTVIESRTEGQGTNQGTLI